MNGIGHDTPPDGSEQYTTGSKRPSDSAGQSKKTDKSKRLRVSRACDQCRAARERCDGAQPTCSTCSQAERSCSYKEQPKKRGIQPNYIRTLELTLAWIFQNNPDAERALAEALPTREGQAHQTISFKDVPSADALHQIWRGGIIYRQIDQLLSGAEIDVPEGIYLQQFVARSAAERNLPYQSPPLSAPSDLGAIQIEHDPAADYGMAAAELRNNLTADAAPVERLRLPHCAWALLEHYFAFTHTWLPITEKHDILRLMYSYPQEGLLKTEATASEHAELWAIMAWSAFRLSPGKHDRACLETARNLIPTDEFALGHVKALLVLSLIDLTKSSLMAAWLGIGTAVRILTHLASDPASERAMPRGRHIFLAAYLLECAVASKTGALAHLRTTDVQPMGLLIEDGLEEWSPWSDPADSTAINSGRQPARSISTFNELVRISLQANTPHSAISGGRGAMRIILELLENTRADGRRQHPASLVAESILQKTHDSPSISPTQPRTQFDHFDFEFWQKQSDSMLNSAGAPQSYPFMSIPHGTNESLSGDTPDLGLATGPTPSVWQGRDAQAGASVTTTNNGTDDLSGAARSADIFEELAILDRTDAAQNPRFLQNLGFGPDLDLAEFFGVDYQPSDPMLPYMDTGRLGDDSQDFASSGKDAG